jgi:hypothetical protein
MDWNNEEVKIPAILFLNFILSLGTVFLHTCASSFVHRTASGMVHRLGKAPTILDETIVVTTVVLILSVFHFLEVVLWGTAFFALGAVRSVPDAFYYSLTTYTTLGPTDVAFDQRFRALAGFESLLGPLMIAWSTAALATVLTRLAALKIEK